MRVGDSVYHASRINEENAEIAEYGQPKKYTTRFNYLTVMPASSRGGLVTMQFGEALYDTWTVVANANAFSQKIKEGDLFWVDGEKPIESVEREYGNGASANAYVQSALPVNHTISIVLRRNQNQIKQ